MRSRTAALLAVPALLAALSGCAGSSSAGNAPELPPPTYGDVSSSEAQSAEDYGVADPSADEDYGTTTTQAAPAPKPKAAAPPAKTSPAFDGLKPGDNGGEVRALQEKLQSLGFWVGSSDGKYGLTTTQAVMAVQKAAGLKRDGVMGSQTRKALERGVSVNPKSTGGRWLEIDKSKQLAMIVDGGDIKAILNTSTGSGERYTSEGRSSVANTPSGKFEVFRQVDALDKAPLGELWRPKYFNGGIAIHGSDSIPGYPASHGCARISNPAIDWIWASGQLPIGTNVWVY